MPALSLRYDCCARRKPYYLNKSEIETVAREARAQLVSPGADALTLAQLAAISDLTINGLPYQLQIIGDRPRFIWVLILARVQANSCGIHSQNSIPSS